MALSDYWAGTLCSVNTLDKGMIGVLREHCRPAQDLITLLKMVQNLKLINYFCNF